jgi:hypothetical protein
MVSATGTSNQTAHAMDGDATVAAAFAVGATRRPGGTPDARRSSLLPWAL